MNTGMIRNVSIDLESQIEKRASFLSKFEHRFEIGSSAMDMLYNDEYWAVSVPNEYSGPCYTYNPPLLSDPGKTVSLYMIFNMSTWDPDLQIFLHDPNALFYSTNSVVNTKTLDIEILKYSAYPRAVGK